MARSRNIKPGFFENEDLNAECSVEAQLCFAGLWTMADRDGRLEDRPKRIKGQLFRYRSLEVEPLLEELHRWNFIDRYEIGALRIIQIVKFSVHQSPHHREAPSELPPRHSPGLSVVGNAEEPGAFLSSDPPIVPGQPKTSPGTKGQRATSQGRRAALIPDSLIPDSLIPDSQEETSSPPKKRRTGQHPLVSLPVWYETVRAKGEEAVPADDPVFAYAAKIELPREFLALAWREFRTRHSKPDAKRYRDWRAVFRNAIEGNWLRLWYLAENGYQLTTAGQQAQRAHAEE